MRGYLAGVAARWKALGDRRFGKFGFQAGRAAHHGPCKRCVLVETRPTAVGAGKEVAVAYGKRTCYEASWTFGPRKQTEAESSQQTACSSIRADDPGDNE